MMCETSQGGLVPGCDIIPGLPDDIALDCLARVPFRYQSTVKSVCHDWRHLFCDSLIVTERRRLGLSENLFFLVQPQPTTPESVILSDNCDVEIVEDTDNLPRESKPAVAVQNPQFGLSVYNATTDQWSRLALIDDNGASIQIPMFCQVVAVAGKLILLGGWDPATLEPVPYVYIIDLLSGQWRKGADMITARSFFACAAAEDSTVLVAGGHDRLKNALKSAELYDFGKNEWRAIPEMHEERDECHGFFSGDNSGQNTGKVWVVSGYGTDSQGRFRSDGERFDIEKGIWEKFEGVWPFRATSPRIAAADGCRKGWWWVDGEKGEVNGFDWGEWKWKCVGKFSGPKGGPTWVTVAGGGDRVVALDGGGEDGDAVVLVMEAEGKGGWSGGGDQRNVGNAAFVGAPFSGVGVRI
ncbi:hypothetical protein Droror1_Dr00001150 [Drosera rotundifolia]